MFYPPLGPAMLLTGWPPEGVMLAVEILLTASLGAILVGAFTRTASLTAAACGLILTTLLYSGGKIDHAILWTVLIPAVMAWTSWGDSWSVDAGRERIRRRNGFQSDACRPVALVALALGVVFGTAATIKALTGWLEPGTSSILGWVFAQAVQEGRQAGPPPFFSATPGFVWLVIDYVIVIFEAGFLVAAARRHWLLPYLLVAASFHAGASLVGFPAFIEIAAVYLLFIRLDAVAARLRHPLEVFGRAASQHPVPVCAVTALALVLYCVAALRLGDPLTVVWTLDAANVPGALVWLMLWPAVIVVSIIAYLKRTKPPEDRPGDSLPPWAGPASVAVLATQTAFTMLVSEPYPALTGPRFMGTFDDGHAINIAEQHFWIVNGGRRTEVDHTDVLDMSQAGAVELGEVRFPGPDLDISGRLTEDPSLQDRLRNQYHHFSAAHLPDYGGPLSDTEKAWIRSNLANQDVACDPGCALEVEWHRLSFDRATGDLILEESVGQQNYPLH
jgi:hypothetical protein